MTEEHDHELARARARIGNTLRGKYTLDRVLGIGGMAVVYAATHRNKKRFAVKMLHPELSMRHDVRERFVREGYVANTIEHPNALAVLDDDVAEDGAAFVVMELLTGQTLEELWESQGHTLPPRAVLAMADGLLDVLAAAHDKSIVHRDIKPANVFILADGTVKVLDFGIARLRDAASKGATSTGMVLGTPAFLPPEQALAKSSEIDHRTDLWAVGATMFTVLSGVLVHEGENGAQLVIQTATQHARSLAKAAPGLSPPIIAIVDRALAFEKVNRWNSATAMRNAIASTYQLLFDEPISKAPLAALMAGVSVASAGGALGIAMQATAPAPQAPPHQSNGRLPSAPAIPATLAWTDIGTNEAGGGFAAQARGLGGTTAQPVISALGGSKERKLLAQSTMLDTSALPRKLTWLAPVAVLALLLVVGGVGLAMRLKSQGEVVAGLVAPPPSVASLATGAAAVPSAAAATAIAIGAPDTAPKPGAGDASVATTVAPIPARVMRSNPGAVAAAAPSAAAPPVTSAAGVPAPNPNCATPYSFDSLGKKIWKKECL